MKIKLDNGKYTYIFNEQTGEHKALRYGEEWRDLVGDGLILAMAQEIERLQKQLDNALDDLAVAEAWAGGLANEHN